MMLRFEHFALNLENPHAIADWYVQTLGCKIVSKLEAAPFTVFLGDATGRVFCEMYHNPKAPLSGVCFCDPAIFHFAFAVDDADTAKDRILGAGGAYVNEIRTDTGSVLITMRDPFGLAVQLCERVPAFLRTAAD